MMKSQKFLGIITISLITIPSVSLIGIILPALADCTRWHPHHCSVKPPKSGYETNKFDLKAQVEGGGWTTSWADDISETDAALGVVAAGVSIYSANSAPFIAWVEQLVQRTVYSISADLTGNARKESEKLARQIIYDAVSGKSPKAITKQFDTIDFKAGAIKYSGRNYVGGTTISRTWGLKPYVAFKVRSSSQSENSSTWKKLPGSAKDVGDGWVIGTKVEQEGYAIYRWTGSTWQKIPGSAVRIGGNSSNPWIVNNEDSIFQWNGSKWIPFPGSAKDVGDGWVIGTKVEQEGYAIYRWTGSTWQKIPGSAVHIGGNSSNPWVVNNEDSIYRQ